MANNLDDDINVEPLATVTWQNRTTVPTTDLLKVGYTAVDPNGLRAAPIGSLLSGPAGTWQNTDGMTAWVALTGGGPGGPWQEILTTVSLINGGDQVGVGTTAPLAGTKLDVVDTAGLTGGRFFFAGTRFFRIGSSDSFAREQLWFTGTDSVLRLGANVSDGDPFDANSEGIVVYHPALPGDQLARVKADQFALTRASDSSLNYYRVDETRLFYSSNPLAGPVYPIGSVHLLVDRATGFVGINNLVAGFPVPFGAEKLRVQGDARVDGKLTVTGAIDPVSLRLSDPLAGTALYLESANGQTAPVSALNEGRIRYNTALQQWERSENGGAYVPFTGGGGGSPDGYPLTYNAAAAANTGSVFKDWPVLQAAAAVLAAAGSSFWIQVASDLTFPVGASLIGQGLFAAIASPQWFIDVPEGVTWVPSAIDFACDGSMLFNFVTTATRVLTAGTIRFTISNGVTMQVGFGSTISPFLINGGGGEGGGGAHEIVVTSGALIDISILPLIEADSDDTSIRVFLEDQPTTISPATFGSTGTGTLSFFWRDPTVRTGTIGSSDQTTTWVGGGLVKYMQRLFPFTGQVAAAGGVTKISGVLTSEQVLATCAIPDSWLNEANLTARLSFGLQCTVSNLGTPLYIRARLGVGGPILYESPVPVTPVVDGVCNIDLKVRTVTPDAAGVVDVWGFAPNVAFDGGGTMGSFLNAGVATPFILPSGINVVVTVTFSLAVAGTSIRCNGAVLDLAGPAVIP